MDVSAKLRLTENKRYDIWNSNASLTTSSDAAFGAYNF
jgi:hypothetical protein